MRISHLVRVLLCGVLVSVLLPALAQKALDTFTVTEHFGVSHPSQIIDFPLKAPVDAKKSYLVNDAGAEVPYQLIGDGKKLAIQTDLPAGATKTWTLYGGRAPKAAGTLQALKTPNGYEVTNELTGVRIPLVPANLAQTPAPVAGIRLRDGTWTAAGPAYLSMAAKAMAVTLKENGPLKVVVEVRYAFDRPERRAYDNRPLIPAGEGYYTSTISLEAGQPSILFEEESDCDLTYALNLSDGIQPTQGRYRGHHANSKEAGYEADGRQYRMWHERSEMDAFTDLKYDVPRAYRKLAVWDPWCFDTGWYWQFYNDKAPNTANMAGIFAGPASRAYRTDWSGVNLYTAPLGVTDLTTAADAIGNIHAVYVSGGIVWYVKFDGQLQAGKPERVDAGIVNPDLLVREDGSIAIAGYDSAQKAFVRAERVNGQFVVKPIAIAEADALQMAQPYIYQASSAGIEYLLLFGTYKTGADGLLFTRKAGEAQFTYQEAIKGAACNRQVARPVFSRLANGSVSLLYSNGQYAEVALIARGATTFAGTADQRRLFNNEQTRLLDFGESLDARSGAMLIGNQMGVLTYIAPNGTVTTSPALSFADHNGQGPNRRTLAVAPDGTALGVHNGELFLVKGGQIARFDAGNALKLFNPQVQYLNGQFAVIGRKDGMLTAYGWKPDDAAPRLASQLPETFQRAMGLTVTFWRGDDNPPNQGRWTDRARFAWGLFVGTKADLADPYQVQPIARQMNIHSGINLQKLVHWQLDYPDPKRGYGAIYMDGKIIQGMIAKLRDDKGGPYGGGYYQYLFNAEPYSRDMITMLADTTGEKAHKAAQQICDSARALLDKYVNGDGIYDFTSHYWMGAGPMNSAAVVADQVLAIPQITPDEKAKLKATLALFANIVWDDDFVPMNGKAGVNLGNENMPVQMAGYRDFFALLLNEHPTMHPHAEALKTDGLQRVRAIVNEYGAEIGCVHYIGASFLPTLSLMQAIQQQGEVDPFKVEPRLAKFAEFYMNLLTPPEGRFGGPRYLISTGDGPTESSPIFGQLATGFAKANPELSKRVMWAWRQGGKPHANFGGTTLLRIDDSLPDQDSKLGNANFPGYYAVLRHGWGTPNETAIWFINGDFYRDHRHLDKGEVIMYALGLPLSLDWGAQYAPSTGGGIMHSAVLLEPMFGQPWDQDVKNLNGGSTWARSDQTAYAAFRTAAFSQGNMTDGKTTWTRASYSIHPNDAYPALIIRDTFAGEQAAVAKIFTLNLMAQGPVQTPIGVMTPPVRTWGDGYNDKINHEYPSAGQVFALQPGVNKLGFTGAQFGTPEKPLPGIDFDLYTVSDLPQQAHIGDWADNWVAGAASLFQTANGRPYEERQHILRIRGAGPFTTVILPWRKGQPRVAAVTREGALLVITAGDEKTTIGDSFYNFAQGAKKGLVAFTGAKAAGEGITIDGGPAEVLLDAAAVTITVAGAAGARAITLPGAWKAKDPKAPAKLANGTWTVEYAGGEALTVVLVKP